MSNSSALFLERYTSAMLASIYKRPEGFECRADDLLISTFPKTGTTWMSQIVHQLRTGGDEDFEVMNRLIPFALDPKLQCEQIDTLPYHPRVWKSHLTASDTLTMGCQTIVVSRAPEPTMLSNHAFFTPIMNVPELSVDDFYFDCYKSGEFGADYWQFLKDVYEQRSNSKLLWLFYEDMRADLPAAVKRVADFMNIALSDELLKLVVHRSSMEYMKNNRTKFDDSLEIAFCRERAKIAGSEDTLPFVTKIRGDNGKQLSAAVQEDMCSQWVKYFPQIKNYEELRKIVNKN